MFISEIEREVQRVEQSMLALAGRLDPDGIPASEAPRLFERLDRVVRTATAARTLVARRVEDSTAWQRRGFHNAAEYLAATSGTSLSAARNELDTSRAIEALPGVREAMVDGTLSAPQAAVIADAAKANPGAAAGLLAAATKTNLRELREEAGRVKAAADADPMATHARIHRTRRLPR